MHCIACTGLAPGCLSLKRKQGKVSVYVELFYEGLRTLKYPCMGASHFRNKLATYIYKLNTKFSDEITIDFNVGI